MQPHVACSSIHTAVVQLHQCVSCHVSPCVLCTVWVSACCLAQAADIDLDKANAAGFTIRQIVQQQQQQAGGPHPDSPARPNSSGSVRSRGTHSPVSSTDTDRAAAVAAAAAAGAAAAKSGYGLSGAAAAAVEDEDDWMDKLAYEMSYDDGGGGGGWRG